MRLNCYGERLPSRSLGFGSQLESAGLCGNSPCSRLSPSHGGPWNNFRLIRILPGTFRRPRSYWILTCAAMLWLSAFSSSAVHCRCAAKKTVPFQQAPISSSTWVIMMSRMSQQHVKKSYEPLQNTTTRRAAHHSGLAYTQFWGIVLQCFTPRSYSRYVL